MIVIKILCRLRGLIMSTAKNNTNENIEEKIKLIILHGTSNHPRAIQQAMSAFQSRWLVVRYRDLEQKIIPEILAILLLLPPNMFDAIFNCPSYFFYLYALATGNPNSVCTALKLQELYELGLPKKTILDQYRYLSDLFSQYDLPEGFNYDDLIPHLTLQYVDIVAVKADTNTDPVWDALNSKDPARIVQADHDRGDDVCSLFSLQMSTALTDIINQPAEDLRKMSKEKKDQLQNAIIVAGLLDSLEAIDLLCELLTIEGLSTDIQIRVLYSISHYSFRKGKQSTRASQTIIDFVSNANKNLRARVCAVRLARHLYLVPAQSVILINLLENAEKRTPRILHNAILDTIIDFRWKETWETIIDTITPEMLSPGDVINLLSRRKIGDSTAGGQEAELGQWPIRKEIVDYLIDLSVKSIEYRDPAVWLLKNHENQERAMQWITDLVLKCQEAKKSLADNTVFKSLEEDCWDTLQGMQIKLENQWQVGNWEKIISYLITNNWPEDMIKFIPALLGTKNGQAVSTIKNFITQLPLGKWRETTLENLLKLAENQSLDANLRQNALSAYNLLVAHQI